MSGRIKQKRYAMNTQGRCVDPFPLCVGLLVVIMASVVPGCQPEESALLPYEPRSMSSITVEQNTFVPKVTWLGGYASVFAVNQDTVAKLDSTLVWLVRVPGNNLRFPLTFGQLPQGAQDLTTSYGGKPLSKLTEDKSYTFWVLKDEVWTQVAQTPGHVIVPNAAQGAPPVQSRNDTVFVSAFSHTQLTSRLDVYVNIKELKLFGRLADISVQMTDTCNRPWVSWRIRQSGVTDTLLSAIGVVMGGQYDVDLVVWEMVSQVGSGPDTVYFKHNVIRGPMQMGGLSPNTYVSVPFIELIRGQDYYIWMANKDWNGESRTRSTNFYCFATFKVW